MVSSGRSNTFSSVITSSSTGLALPVAGVYTFYTVSLVAFPVRAVAAANVGLPFVLIRLVAGVLFEALSFVQLRKPIRVLELAAEHPVTPEQIEVRTDKRGYRGGK